VLDYATFHFTRYAVFQPVINGIGGNMVAINASRMSTALHKKSKVGDLPPDFRMWRGPISAFFDKTEPNVEMARNLCFISIPVHVVYMLVVVLLKENTTLTIPFVLSYIIAGFIQVVVLQYLAYHLTNLMWKSGIDPDNTSIPILTATGDFLGSFFLFCAFLILGLLNDVNAIE
jgi:solute carrier family 41